VSHLFHISSHLIPKVEDGRNGHRCYMARVRSAAAAAAAAAVRLGLCHQDPRMLRVAVVPVSDVLTSEWPIENVLTRELQVSEPCFSIFGRFGWDRFARPYVTGAHCQHGRLKVGGIYQGSSVSDDDLEL
jgi:hypothetical protein